VHPVGFHCTATSRGRSVNIKSVKKKFHLAYMFHRLPLPEY